MCVYGPDFVQAAPLYLSEMAAWDIRGALNIMFQLMVTVGIFVAQLINYGTSVSAPDCCCFCSSTKSMTLWCQFACALCLPVALLVVGTTHCDHSCLYDQPVQQREILPLIVWLCSGALYFDIEESNNVKQLRCLSFCSTQSVW